MARTLGPKEQVMREQREQRVKEAGKAVVRKVADKVKVRAVGKLATVKASRRGG